MSLNLSEDMFTSPIPSADIINAVTVTCFGIEHRFNDGFTYGQPFWLVVASTVYAWKTILMNREWYFSQGFAVYYGNANVGSLAHSRVFQKRYVSLPVGDFSSDTCSGSGLTRKQVRKSTFFPFLKKTKFSAITYGYCHDTFLLDYLGRACELYTSAPHFHRWSLFYRRFDWNDWIWRHPPKLNRFPNF